MKSMINKREMYFDYLRIFAILGVIGIHVVGINWFDTNVKSLSWQVLNVYSSMCRYCVPIFVMISGALFLNQSKKLDIKKLYLKNIFRLFIALVFWSLVYAVFSNIIMTRSFNMSILKDTIKMFLSGYYHLWYIPMMIGLYIAVPMFKKICEDKKIEEYFLIIFLIFTTLIPFLAKVPKLDIILGNGIFSTSVAMVSGFAGYFVLGHYLDTYILPKKYEISIYVLGVLSLLFTIVSTAVFSIYKGFAFDAFYDSLTINNTIYIVAIFIFFKYHVGKIKLSDNIKNIIVKISNLIFGVYLIHNIFIALLIKFNIVSSSLICSLLCPLFIILVLLLSLICSFIISKIPILNKYII